MDLQLGASQRSLTRGPGFPESWLRMQTLLSQTLHFNQTPGGTAKSEKQVGAEQAPGHSYPAPSSVTGVSDFTSLFSHLQSGGTGQTDLSDVQFDVFNYACNNSDYFVCQISTKVGRVSENYILHKVKNF